MIDVYPWFAIVSSVLMAGLFGSHALDSATGYRRFHDDRAAVELLIALVLLVAALGLAASAAASFLEPIGVEGRQSLRNFGLGATRGALLVGAATMVLVDRHLPYDTRRPSA